MGPPILPFQYGVSRAALHNSLFKWPRDPFVGMSGSYITLEPRMYKIHLLDLDMMSS